MYFKTATAILLSHVVGLLGACTAKAEPPKFPDMSSYAPVNAEDYVISLPNVGREPIKKVYFVTPDGIHCSFLGQSAGCTGNIPGVSAKDKNPYTDIGTDSGVQPMGSTPFVDGKIQGHELKSLPPLHSLTSGGVTCGVDGKGTTACKDSKQRGFIISQDGTSWFPHV